MLAGEAKRQPPSISGAMYDVYRCLFVHGPTWDGDIPSKSARDDLCDRGHVHHEFGYAWLTREGVEFAIKGLGMDRVKDRLDRERRAGRAGL